MTWINLGTIEQSGTLLVMNKWRVWIVWLCGLLLVVQGVASAASLPETVAKSPAAPMMQMVHCHMAGHHQSGNTPKCCGEQCHDMANCFSPAASQTITAHPIIVIPAAPPPPHLVAHFVAHHPDPRLRPPTVLLA